MKNLREDQTHLIALVALLISTAGFKEELKQADINNTGITLFDIFLYGTVALGFILFMHLILNYTYLFLSSLREKRKDWTLVLLRGSIMLIMASIPISVVYVATSRWLFSEVCSYYQETDFLGETVDDSAEPKQICTTPLMSTILPLIGGLLVTSVVVGVATKREKEFYNLPKEAQILSAQIAEYRIMQATSGNLERINEIQKTIDELTDQYIKAVKSTDPEE